MHDLIPDGETLRKAVRWVSESLQMDADQEVPRLVQQAIFTFNLSPKDADFLIGFFRDRKQQLP